ncbi:MAG: hypothetical protein QW717_06480 [Candidatus Bathyarchaeia archaeon]
MDKKKHEYMEKLDSIYKVVQQSSTGISAVGIAKKLGKPESYRTTVHRYLNTLELMGKVYSEKGLWYAKEPKENSIIGKEIELTIELPILDKEIAVAEAQLRVLCEALKEINADDPLKTFLEALKDARTIKIKGRNIEAIKEQLPKLIEEALQKQNKLKNKSFWRRLTK